MKKYRKKPLEIEAMQFTGDNALELVKIIGEGSGAQSDPDLGTLLTVPALEGSYLARPGWWIIKGIKGEFYPCAPDIFKETYEEVENVR